MKYLNFLFLLFTICLLTACSKNDEDTGNPAPSDNTPVVPVEKVLPVYFKGIIDNVPLVLETNYYKKPSPDSVLNGPGGSSYSSTLATDTLNFIYNSTIIDQRKNKEKFITVYFSNYYNYSLGVPLPSFEQVFSPGIRQFRYNLSGTLGQAVAIQYRDDNGIYWSTSKQYINAASINLPKPPTFTGQTFELVSAVEQADLSLNPQGNKYLLANIKFNCYLYNSNGDSIHFQNAEFQGLFKSFKP